MISGPGLECAYIFPEALLKWYNYPNTSSRQDKWSDVNNLSNCVLMDPLCYRLHDNRLLAIHPVSTKHSMSGLFLILCRSRTGFAYLPPFPLSSRETTPKHFSPICFHHLNHRSNGITKLQLLKICGRCSWRGMVDQRDTRGWDDRVLC